jgi:18S rRNA (guanine1575-N7)-methyltransferase
MLRVGVEREVSGDTVESDIGEGLPFRSGMFDGAISVSYLEVNGKDLSCAPIVERVKISAIQWLCNADKSSHNPWQRLNTFFKSLYPILNLLCTRLTS